jgi:hypothetical protein
MEVIFFMDFIIKFKDYSDNVDVLSSILEDTAGYHVWGDMDILVNGISFFINCNEKEINEHLGSSSMGTHGMTVPIFSFIWGLLYYCEKLGNHKVEIEDDQISKRLVIIPYENGVRFSIMHKGFSGINWYNGEGIILSSSDFTINTLNCVPIKDFKLGIKVGIQNFLNDLLSRYPRLTKVDQFNSLIREVEGLVE